MQHTLTTSAKHRRRQVHASPGTCGTLASSCGMRASISAVRRCCSGRLGSSTASAYAFSSCGGQQQEQSSGGSCGGWLAAMQLGGAPVKGGQAGVKRAPRAQACLQVGQHGGGFRRQQRAAGGARGHCSFQGALRRGHSRRRAYWALAGKCCGRPASHAPLWRLHEQAHASLVHLQPARTLCPPAGATAPPKNCGSRPLSMRSHRCARAPRHRRRRNWRGAPQASWGRAARAGLQQRRRAAAASDDGWQRGQRKAHSHVTWATGASHSITGMRRGQQATGIPLGPLTGV